MILRNPCSTSARNVVRSRAAIFRASRKSGSDMSSVVFTFHIHDFANMGSNIIYRKVAADANSRPALDAAVFHSISLSSVKIVVKIATFGMEAAWTKPFQLLEGSSR
jgi:hypothetical protein